MLAAMRSGMIEANQAAARAERGNFFRVDCWLLVIVLVVGWGYFGAALSWPNAALSREPSGYYGLLTKGFEAGHLYVALEPVPALLALADPYDPTANAPFRVHDMSLWQGKYYLYFGVTPVVVFFWPTHFITGFYPTEALAVALFSFGAFGSALLILCAIYRRYFSTLSRGILFLGSVSLGLVTPVWLLNQGPQFYQVAISAGVFFQMVSLAALYAALHAERRVGWWLAAASLAFGLTLGARPNYFFGGFLLVATGIYIWRNSRSKPKELRLGWLGIAMASLAPAFAIGVGLLAYNFFRFGSVTEFGMKYQLAGMKVMSQQSMAWANFRPHLSEYFFNVGTWSVYFPFFTPPSGVALGTLRYFPWLWLGPVGLGLIAWKTEGKNRRLLFFASLLLAAGALNVILISFFFGTTTERYRSDFVPAWLLLAAIAALALSHTFRWRRVAAMMIYTSGFFSLFIAMAAFARGLKVDGAVLPIARFANWPVEAIQHQRGEEWGSLQLLLRLPEGKVGRREILVQTGRTETEKDWWWIEYLAADRARVGFFHAGWGEFPGEAFLVPANRRVSVELFAGSLLPPFSHPRFTNWSLSDYTRLSRQLEVRINGAAVLEAAVNSYPSERGGIVLGKRVSTDGSISGQFSGQILSTRRERLDSAPFALPIVDDPGTPLELQLFFPADRLAGAEPLVATGRGAQSDLLYCEYGGVGRVRLVLDHYGGNGRKSDWIAFDPLKVHQLRIWMGSFGEAKDVFETTDWRRRLIATLDGAPVFNVEQEFFSAGGNPIAFGFNRSAATTAQTEFNGRIIAAKMVTFADLPTPDVSHAHYGAVDMTVEFPRGLAEVADPLVVTGKTGAGDLLYVRYLAGSRILFGLDHWGVSGVTGEPITVDLEKAHRLEITMGSLFPSGTDETLRNSVEVRLDGRVVLTGKTAFHPTTVEEIHLLSNSIGGSTCGADFQGKIISVRQLPIPR